MDNYVVWGSNGRGEMVAPIIKAPSAADAAKAAFVNHDLVLIFGAAKVPEMTEDGIRIVGASEI